MLGKHGLQPPLNKEMNMTTTSSLEATEAECAEGRVAPRVGLGRKLAYEDAVRQLWPLMGYALREKLAADPVSSDGQSTFEG